MNNSKSRNEGEGRKRRRKNLPSNRGRKKRIIKNLEIRRKGERRGGEEEY